MAVPRSFERGEVIFREGDTGDTCYVIRGGSVSIRREHMDGRTLALAELRAGAIFGELAMFGTETRSATAEALEQTHLVAILSGDMQRVLRVEPDIASRCSVRLAERLRARERAAAPAVLPDGRRAGWRSALLTQVIARQAEGAGDSEVLSRRPRRR